MAKGHIKLSIDVEGVDKTLARLEAEIGEALRDAGDDLVYDAWKAARFKLRVEDAIWNKDVLRRFQNDVDQDPDGSVEATLRNYSDHARVVEYGATWTTEPPNFKNLIPWVKDNLGDWHPDLDADYGGGGGPPDGDDGPVLNQIAGEDEIEVGETYLWKEPNATIRGTVVNDRGDGTFDIEVNGVERNVAAYKAIVRDEDHPLGTETFVEINEGTMVWYRDEDNNLIQGIVDSRLEDYDSPDSWRNPYVEVEGEEFRQNVTLARIVRYDNDWRDGPDYDLFEPDMRRSDIDGSAMEATDLYYNARVAVYDKSTDSTHLGTFKHSPYEKGTSTWTVVGDDGTIYELDEDTTIAGYTDWLSLTNDEQHTKLAEWVDDFVDTSNLEPGVETYVIGKFKSDVWPTYKDRDFLREVYQRLVEIRHDPNPPDGDVNKTRAHVGTVDGKLWRLQMRPNQPAFVLTHEDGHAFSKPTDNDYAVYNWDPDDHQFAHFWPKQDEAAYSHMYADGLPAWDVDDDLNAFHGTMRKFMHTPDSEEAWNKVAMKADGSIGTDNRHEIKPLGFDSWKDDIYQNAVDYVSGKSPATRDLKQRVKQVHYKQVMDPEDFKLKPGDYATFRVGGETRSYRLRAFHADHTPYTADTPDAPTKAPSAVFEDLADTLDRDLDLTVAFDADGNMFKVKYDSTDDLYKTTSFGVPEFEGWLRGDMYDHLREPWPELVSKDPKERLQEAGNMGFYYQAVTIAKDQSPGKYKSQKLVFQGGYSATNSEETIAELTSRLVRPNGSTADTRDWAREWAVIIKKYPRFVEALLETRNIRNDTLREILEKGDFIT